MSIMSLEPVELVAYGSMGMALGGIVTQFSNMIMARRTAAQQAKQQERQANMQETQADRTYYIQLVASQRNELKDCYNTIKGLEDLLRANKEEQLKNRLKMLEYERQCDNKKDMA